jgi:hypothetical protein
MLVVILLIELRRAFPTGVPAEAGAVRNAIKRLYSLFRLDTTASPGLPCSSNLEERKGGDGAVAEVHGQKEYSNQQSL